jgi:hypothetical protein
MAYFAGASTLNFGGNSPTGNFVPEIFSKKSLNIFRRRSTVEAITNTDYYGEISAFGDTVRIIKEPSITVTSHLRNDTVTPQALDDDQILLVLDKANRFAFKVDDIEEKISHINWMSLATDRAAYELKQAFDNEVLTYMSTGALAGNVLNDTARPDHPGCSPGYSCYHGYPPVPAGCSGRKPLGCYAPAGYRSSDEG